MIRLIFLAICISNPGASAYYRNESLKIAKLAYVNIAS